MEETFSNTHKDTHKDSKLHLLQDKQVLSRWRWQSWLPQNSRKPDSCTSL